MDITFASLLTIEGTVIAAAIVTSLVELLKRVGDIQVAGAWVAFLLSAILYIFAAIATNVVGAPAPLDAGLAVFLAFLGCATSAVGIHSSLRTATRLSA